MLVSIPSLGLVDQGILVGSGSGDENYAYLGVSYQGLFSVGRVGDDVRLYGDDNLLKMNCNC